MSLLASLSPANARSAQLPGASADATRRSTGAPTNSFSSVLDRAVSPARERALAPWDNKVRTPQRIAAAYPTGRSRLRSSRGRAAGGGDAGDSRIELKPIKEGRRKVREELQESLTPWDKTAGTPQSIASAYPTGRAGASAVAPAPAHGVELDRSPGRQMLRPPPAALDAAGSATEPAPVAPPPLESTGADGKAGANVPVELVPVVNVESSIVEKPDANPSVDTNKEFVSAGQPTADDSLSAGTDDLAASTSQFLADELIELVSSKSELASPLQTNRNEATQGWSTNNGSPRGIDGRNTLPGADLVIPRGEGLSALQKELVDGNKNSRGIAAAKLDEQMKNTVKQDEIAASAEQILPGAQTVQLRPARADASREGRRNLVESVLSEALVGAASAKDTMPTAGTELPLASDVLTGQLSPVDRMTKVISREVQIFKRIADETMEVVLTPDQHTQISLRLQWREGKVEMLALCQQGDYHALNTQWSQLQTALAHQGVRLSQLSQPAHTGYTDFFSSAGFTQSQNGGQRRPEPKVALDTLPPVAVSQPSGKPQPSAAARARRLLESWA